MEIFENERKGLLGAFAKRHMIYTDKAGPWSTRDLEAITKEQIIPPQDWSWDGEWTIETDDSIEDDDGWRVNKKFSKKVEHKHQLFCCLFRSIVRHGFQHVVVSQVLEDDVCEAQALDSRHGLRGPKRGGGTSHPRHRGRRTTATLSQCGSRVHSQRNRVLWSPEEDDGRRHQTG